ncbi:MAG: hypothetical protein EHM62_06185 [Methylococcus sp.]|nr:MAG: hypothetical protein EHM62_06185 [Methylococcus sp.]
MTTDIFDLIAAEYTGPNKPSLLSLATKYDIPETTLRRAFKARGIIRGTAAQRKRQLVEDHFSGETADDLTNPEVMQAKIEIEAAADIEDMNDALTVCRKAIRRLLDVVETIAEPREIKAICDANEKAMLTIRKIRGLDAPLDFSDWSDDELQLLAQTGRVPSNRR